MNVACEFLPMGRHDLAAVAAIEAEIESFPWSCQHFADSLANGHCAWVLREGVDTVGYLVLMRAVDEVHLLTIGVARPRQRRGYGARLLQFGLDRTAALGARSMLLEVRISNAPAQALYRHFGFAEIGRRKSYYPAANGREDALVFERAVSEVRI
jgi:[ribosomal protein S18]-alanine N-acetyltransferase